MFRMIKFKKLSEALPIGIDLNFMVVDREINSLKRLRLFFWR